MTTPQYVITYTTQSRKRHTVRTPDGPLRFPTINDALYRAARMPWDQADDPAVSITIMRSWLR